MEFFIKTKPEFKKLFQVGMEVKMTDIGWVTVTKIEDENVFFKATEESEKYLESLFVEKRMSFSIEGKSQGK